MWLAAALCILPYSIVRSQSPVSAAATPNTFYVDSLAGDDAHDGTSPASAWKSLARVNSATFLPGQKILLKSGSVFHGQLWPKGSGSADSPIVLSSYAAACGLEFNATAPPKTPCF